MQHAAAAVFFVPGGWLLSGHDLMVDQLPFFFYIASVMSMTEQRSPVFQ
jgi:hypothetical protein